MDIIQKPLIILVIAIISSCSSIKYEKASGFKYYGYKDKKISDNIYEVSYRVNYKTSLKQCVDLAFIRASQIALESNKDFSLKKIEAYRSYEKNPKKLTGTFVSSAAVGEKYAMDRVGNATLQIKLSEKGISSCGVCTVISKEYGDDFFGKDFCKCIASKNDLVKSEKFLERNYSKFNQEYFTKSFDGIDPFDLDKAFNPNKEKP